MTHTPLPPHFENALSQYEEAEAEHEKQYGEGGFRSRLGHVFAHVSRLENRRRKASAVAPLLDIITQGWGDDARVARIKRDAAIELEISEKAIALFKERFPEIDWDNNGAIKPGHYLVHADAFEVDGGADSSTFVQRSEEKAAHGSSGPGSSTTPADEAKPPVLASEVAAKAEDLVQAIINKYGDGNRGAVTAEVALSEAITVGIALGQKYSSVLCTAHPHGHEHTQHPIIIV